MILFLTVKQILRNKMSLLWNGSFCQWGYQDTESEKGKKKKNVSLKKTRLVRLVMRRTTINQCFFSDTPTQILNSATIVHKAHVICVFLEKTNMRQTKQTYLRAYQRLLGKITKENTPHGIVASQAERWRDNLSARRRAVEGHWVVCAALLSK